MYTKITKKLMFASRQMIYVIILQILAMELIFASTIHSQSINQTKVSVSFKKAGLAEVFSEIEQKTDFVFIYNSMVIDGRTTISLSRKDISLAELLAKVSEKTSLSFRQINYNIYVSKLEAEDLSGRQQKKEAEVIVSGNVMDAESNAPLVGVTILIKGENRGTTSDVEGNFSLQVADYNTPLIFNYIGYVSKEIIPTNSNFMNVSLEVDTRQLSEIVVTALGIEKDKSTLVSAVQEVKGEALTEARETNLINNLSGRVAGLDIQRSSAGLSGSVRAVLRGESSLNINKNQPLFVVNGVPINNEITPSGSGHYGGSDLTVDYGNGASEINPDDVESITVLKGPSAAALYGSRAANGVIMIKTKSGKDSKGLGVSVNTNTVFDNVLRLPDYQNVYGAGGVAMNDYYSYGPSADGASTANTGHNWGPKFNGQQFVQYGSPIDESGNRIPIDWKAYPNNVRDFFETGVTLNNNVSVQGANDKGHFRVSYTNLDQTGIFPNTELKRNSFSVNTGYNLTRKINISTNLNYVKSTSDNLPNSGYGAAAPMYAFIWFERNADMNWLRDYWTPGKEGLQQNYFHTWADNPYFVAYEHINTFNKDRIYGNISLNYQITDELQLMVRSGTDFSNETRTFKRPYSTVGLPRGRYKTQDVYFNEINSDFLLSYTKMLNQDWNLHLSAGGNRMTQVFRNNENDARELTIPGVYNMGNASGLPIIREFNAEKHINSLYGLGEISFRESIYLNFTGRNDWSSTLPLSNNSYFYPSVGLSTVLSNLLSISPDAKLSYAKIRASWAQVGNDTDPYRLNRNYNYGTLTRSVTNQSTIPNADLKPEIATSYELGFDIRFFGSRLGLDFTYYNMSSRNQIISVPIPITTGFTSKVLNAGEIRNQGIELVLNAVPIKTKDFSWEVLVNFSRNRNMVVELSEGIDNYIVASTAMGTVEARKGGRMGDIYGQKLERSPDGEVVYRNGIPQLSPTIQKLGNYNPDWMGGVYNTFKFKNLYLGVLFDTKQGGKIVSLTHGAGSESGILPHTVPGRETGIVGDGVVVNNDGTYSPNTVNIPAPNYYRSKYHRNVTESHTFDASFVKLREVKLGYNLPKSLLSHTPFGTASISVVGRNLLLWAKAPHIDPETTTITGATVIPGFEFTQLPSTRSIGFNINFTL